MQRNIPLGDGCRTVYLPTLDAWCAWWRRHRDQYPVIAYFCVNTPMLEPCREEGNDECEWIVGPSVELVVSKMLEHCGLSTRATWHEARRDGTDFLPGYWEIDSLTECEETARGVSSLWVSDTTISSREASAQILRAFGGFGDHYFLRVWVRDAVDRLIDEEREMRESGSDEYYGHQNEEAGSDNGQLCLW